jgi:hypothetical protein
MDFYGHPRIGQKASDGWGTVSFTLNLRSWRTTDLTYLKGFGAEFEGCERAGAIVKMEKP